MISIGGCGRGIISGDVDEECTTTRCTKLDKNCGEVVVDGCGVVQCGDCVAPEKCGGGGTPNVCGVEDCKPRWECEQPLDGNEKDGCGNRRPNPACDALSPCGNSVADPGEACDWKGNLGCSGSTPVCKPDCSECTAGNEECTKERCLDLGRDCGEIVIDGCGVVPCGECQDPETCGGGGEPNVCGMFDDGPVVWPDPDNRPLIGNWQWQNKSVQNVALLVNGVDVNAIDVNIENGSPASRYPEKIVVYGGWAPATNMCDLTEVQKRFTLAEQNRNNYEYATFLLSEEVWGPNTWNRSCTPTAGSMPLGKSGVTIQLRDTWLQETPGKTEDDWRIYYQYTMLRAWKLHIDAVNTTYSVKKKVAIAGVCGIPYWGRSDGKENSLIDTHFPSSTTHDCLQYVIDNYDLLIAYQYPASISEVSSDSVALANALRNTFGYKGKIAWILTTDFGDLVANYTWTEAIAYAEYAAVAPYVDYIICYHRTAHDTSEDYPSYLRKFYSQYQ